MDLSVLIQDVIVNVRVAGLIKTSRGFLFVKSKKGYVFVLGGRVKLGETSQEAIIREVAEEIGMRVEKPILCAVIENFFVTATEKVQEICFVYKINTIFGGNPPSEFVEISLEDIDKYDLRPKQLADVFKDKNNSFKHIIVREGSVL